MPTFHTVDAARVCEELERFCWGLRAYHAGNNPLVQQSARREARCLWALLGDDRDKIVAKSGRSLTSAYLAELWSDLPWQIESLCGDHQISPAWEIPDHETTERLWRWLELIRQAERGTEAEAPQATQPAAVVAAQAPATAATSWQALESRFREIASRGQNVVMQFAENGRGSCSYTLHNAPVGEWRMVLVGAAEDGSTVQQEFTDDHYAVTELWDLILQAGRLLNTQENRSAADRQGAERFVAMLVKSFRTLAYEDNGTRFFVNAARVCGILAGKLAEKYAGTPDAEKKNWPTITQVARGLGKNKGNVSRLIGKGLRDNGKSRSERRIDPASVLEYCKAKGIAYNVECDDT